MQQNFINTTNYRCVDIPHIMATCIYPMLDRNFVDPWPNLFNDLNELDLGYLNVSLPVIKTGNFTEPTFLYRSNFVQALESPEEIKRYDCRQYPTQNILLKKNCFSENNMDIDDIITMSTECSDDNG